MPKLNHLFMTGVRGSEPIEYQNHGHVDATVIEAIAEWIARNQQCLETLEFYSVRIGTALVRNARSMLPLSQSFFPPIGAMYHGSDDRFTWGFR